MAAFAITETAAIEIRASLEASGYEHPTASLLDGSYGVPLPAEVAEALAKASHAEQLEFAVKEFRERGATLEYRLQVRVFEAGECPPEDLVIVEGLQFAMPKEMREYFTDYVLDYANGKFVLRKGDRVFVRLKDLGNDESAV